MATHSGDRPHPRRADRRPQPCTARVASRGVFTVENVATLGAALLKDFAEGCLGGREVAAFSRGAQLILGAARIGPVVGFSRDLTGGAGVAALRDDDEGDPPCAPDGPAPAPPGPDPDEAEKEALVAEQSRIAARLAELRGRTY